MCEKRARIHPLACKKKNKIATRKCLSDISHFNRIPFLIFKIIIYIQCSIHLVKFRLHFAFAHTHTHTSTYKPPRRELKCLALSVSKIFATLHIHYMHTNEPFAMVFYIRRAFKAKHTYIFFSLIWFLFFFLFFCFFHLPNRLTSNAIITFNKVMGRSIELVAHAFNCYTCMHESRN